MQNFDYIKAQFDGLGVVNFGADLPGGKIHWTNAKNEIVAHGRCKAVISFAGTNNSYIWMSTMSHYDSVPTIPLPEGKEAYVEPCTEGVARSAAQSAALADGADYLYAAPVGGGGFVYLAVYGLVFEFKEATDAEVRSKIRASFEYAISKATAMKSALNTSDFEVLAYAFIADLLNFADPILKGLQASAVMTKFSGMVTDSLSYRGEKQALIFDNIITEAKAELQKLE